VLERLTIRDLALIEATEVTLGPGLTAITGETGSGKSLLVQALDLVLGDRADSGVVREGAASARVEASFRPSREVAKAITPWLAELGIPFDGDTLIVRREVSREGRSRAILNDTTVTLATLKTLGERLADLHGQHEHQSLLRPDAAIATLDQLAGLTDTRERYAETRAAMLAAAAELERIESALAKVGERREWLEDAAREIDEARLAIGEDERLRESAARLAHGERLRELSARALAALGDDDAAAAHGIATAAHAVEQAAALDPALGDLRPTLDEARVAIDETVRMLSEYVSKLDAEPGELEAVESRRELIARLARKHRRSIEELIHWRAEIGSELALAEDGASAKATARAALDQAEAACLAAARSLSRQRAIRGREWSATLTRGLEPLGFPHAQIAFAVRKVANLAHELGPMGADQVDLEFTANPGEPARPLRKIASGGELSRVMLALKSALQAQDSVDVLIFDEVDSGIGGAVAQAVGERLATLARHRQVLCVTHLPMIAACAGNHLRVTKEVRQGRTVARIEPVERDARIEEIARMLAGARATATTLRQARELLGAGSGR
jgi:DNA repair protein RecN (Recombination protein N)